MTKRRKIFVHIRGEGTPVGPPVFDLTIPAGSITDEQLQNALKCLTVKANAGSWTYDEILAAFQKKGTRGRHTRLDAFQSSKQRGVLWVGVNEKVQVVTRLIDDQGKRVDHHQNWLQQQSTDKNSPEDI
jgi:hypothetical protein